MTTTHHSVRVRIPVSLSKINAVAPAAASRTTRKSTSSKVLWKLLARGGEVEETMRKRISCNTSALLRVRFSPRHTSFTYGSLSPSSLFSPFSSSCSSSLHRRHLPCLLPSPTSISPTKVSNKDPRGSRPTSTASSMVGNWQSHPLTQA